MPRPASGRTPRLTTEELSERTWRDFEDLFGRNGGVWGGCWCTFYQAAKGSAWSSGPSNREAHRERLLQGRAHGVIVKDGELPVGWCQFGAREELPRIDGRKGYSVPRDERLWRVTCFFVDRAYRRRGVARAALEAALKSMEAANVRLVEAYPTETGRKTSATLLWSGTPELFAGFGFRKVAKLGKSSWVMQKRLGP
ncbi:MAG TPA: GNAT family N-acetyltransferase [Conexivisphaerales archaeon]|nr:GNAT family N-acetyltransferase [Conexivisphaerales archaeon]